MDRYKPRLWKWSTNLDKLYLPKWKLGTSNKQSRNIGSATRIKRNKSPEIYGNLPSGQTKISIYLRHTPTDALTSGFFHCLLH